MKVLYVFVDILIDLDHFIATWEANFEEKRETKTYDSYKLQVLSSIYHPIQCIRLQSERDSGDERLQAHRSSRKTEMCRRGTALSDCRL